MGVRRSATLHPAGGVAPRSRNTGRERGEAARRRFQFFWDFYHPRGARESEKRACGARFLREGRREGGAATSQRCKIRT